MVAYAYGRLHPQDTRGVMVLDVGLPGIEPWSEAERTPLLWHFHFHQIRDLPELLVQGHQFEYFREFFRRFSPTAITDEDIKRYVDAYGADPRLRAGFEFYRAFPANAEFNQSHRERLTVPLVLAGGERSAAASNPKLATSLRALGVAQVDVEIIRDSGHYVADEQPDAVAALIERYAAGHQ
jgi:pimeloyl-ACP methyl ester carboxylesterase